MTEFILIYYSPQSAMEKMKNSSPEDMKKGMESWMKWFEKCGEHTVDMGSMLSNSKRIDSSGIASGNTEVAGYTILKADDMIKVEELLKGHPHLEWDDSCYIEVHEKMPLPKC